MRGMMGRLSLKCFSISLCVAASLHLPAMAKMLDLVHTIPLEIQGYSEAKTLPGKFTTAQQIEAILQSTPNLLLHMEVLRRGYYDLPTAEQESLLSFLLKRYQATPDNAEKFFDHGYAQLVYKENKTGLFFLRKANDKLQNQFSSLAYAMAQADADVNEEKASPDEMTMRKLDVTYKLGDAVARDAQAHQPGFWPSFVRVIQKLAPLSAYADYADTDFSMQYVPYGSSLTAHKAQAGTETLKTSVSESVAFPPQGTVTQEHHLGCDVGLVNPSPLNWQRLYRSKTISTPSGETYSINFFTTNQEHQYQVAVLNNKNQVITQFSTAIASTSIVEDLDHDGVFELVIRQYQANPFDPIKVYRMNQCSFIPDPTVEAYFR